VAEVGVRLLEFRYSPTADGVDAHDHSSVLRARRAYAPLFGGTARLTLRLALRDG
jgi:hypothetical protein